MTDLAERGSLGVRNRSRPFHWALRMRFSVTRYSFGASSSRSTVPVTCETGLVCEGRLSNALRICPSDYEIMLTCDVNQAARPIHNGPLPRPSAMTSSIAGLRNRYTGAG
jgi:hypothetical protein